MSGCGGGWMSLVGIGVSQARTDDDRLALFSFSTCGSILRPIIGLWAGRTGHGPQRVSLNCGTDLIRHATVLIDQIATIRNCPPTLEFDVFNEWIMDGRCPPYALRSTQLATFSKRRRREPTIDQRSQRHAARKNFGISR